MDVNNNTHTVYVLIVVTYAFNIIQSTPLMTEEEALREFSAKETAAKSMNIFPNSIIGNALLIFAFSYASLHNQ